ncbi:MAG: dockerin type I repeat-containing protein [Clostridia bacterium]|nr:dockerin type I repeat-containing protein [Clostridia bacterium]
MKRILSIVLAVALVLGTFAIYSSAAATYNAKFALTADVNGKTYTSGDIITVEPGATVKVKVNFSNDFYLGSVAAQIFYNSSVFTGATCAFNKDGKVYKISGGSMCKFNDWNSIAATNREKWWPDYSAAKLKAFKETHKFAYLTMIPNPSYGEPAIKNVNETLATLTFTVSSTVKDGTTGQIIIPAESAHRKDYKNGRTMCDVYTSSDMSKPGIVDAEGLKYDMTKAVLNFKVSSAKKGDVNADNSINSSDALLALQYSVGMKTLTAVQKAAADVNNDGNVNSADALKILQYAVGEIKSF